MAVFRGGPALPKRSEIMSSDPNISPATTPSKRKHRTTLILANIPDDFETSRLSKAMHIEDDNNDDEDDSTVADTDVEENHKARLKIDGGGTAIPVSNVRSTLRKAAPAVHKNACVEPDDKTIQRTLSTIHDILEKDEVKFASQPSTPRKAAHTKRAASPHKDVSKTPTKKQVNSVPATPRGVEQAPLASAWQPDHWNDLNFAILKVVLDHAGELFDASPSLAPWRIKGRLHVKVRQLMKEANGGEVASKRWDVELKSARKGNSPKKQP